MLAMYMNVILSFQSILNDRLYFLISILIPFIHVIFSLSLFSRRSSAHVKNLILIVAKLACIGHVQNISMSLTFFGRNKESLLNAYECAHFFILPFLVLSYII